MMMNIMIVDDEILARMGIKSYLKSSQVECHIFTFSDVKSALTHIESNHVDIVITDIEMPDIDGLEFINTLNQLGIDCAIIVLSAHENFEYARKAFLSGADSYILKHELSKDILVNAINSIINKRRQRHPLQINTNPNDINEKTFFSIASIRFSALPEQNVDDVEWDIISQIIDGLLKEKKLGEIQQNGQQLEALLTFPIDESEKDATLKIKNFTKFCNNTLKNYINFDIVWGISPFFYKTNFNLEKFTSKAREAILQQFYFEEESLFFYTKLNNFNDSIPSLPKFEAKELFDSTWIESIESKLISYFNECKVICSNPSLLVPYLENEIYYFTKKCIDFYSITGEFSIKKQIKKNQISNQTSMEHTKKAIINYLFELQQKFKEIVDSRDSFFDIVTYIDNNFCEDISLQGLSTDFYINSNYLSQKFKKEIGITFSDYLNKKRITEVKKLILQNKYSMEEIAVLTGYKSLNYMSRTFKKLTGDTPSLYYKRVFEKQVD